jgi:hypothetical protein
MVGEISHKNGPTQKERIERMTTRELIEENEGLLDLLEEINSEVDLPDDLQDRLEEFLGLDEDEDGDAV